MRGDTRPYAWWQLSLHSRWHAPAPCMCGARTVARVVHGRVHAFLHCGGFSPLHAQWHASRVLCVRCMDSDMHGAQAVTCAVALVLPRVVALILACAMACPCALYRTVWPARCTNGGLRDARAVARVVHGWWHVWCTELCIRPFTHVMAHVLARVLALVFARVMALVLARVMQCMDDGMRARMVACVVALIIARVMALVLARAVALVLAPCMCGARTVAYVVHERWHMSFHVWWHSSLHAGWHGPCVCSTWTVARAVHEHRMHGGRCLSMPLSMRDATRPCTHGGMSPCVCGARMAACVLTCVVA
ncbi:hypothetical protein AAG906_003258 [Vitis piasezkii]